MFGDRWEKKTTVYRGFANRKISHCDHVTHSFFFMSHHKCILLSPLQICYISFCKPSPVRKQFSHSSQTVFFSSMSGNAMVCAGTTTGSTKSSQGMEPLSDAFVAVTTEVVMGCRSQQRIDEHALLLPSKIALIALFYSSFKLIQEPAIIITLFWPLLGCCDHLFETKNYQSMLNQHFVITTRIASRNYFVHKSALYWHSISILKPQTLITASFLKSYQFLQGESNSVSGSRHLRTDLWSFFGSQ